MEHTITLYGVFCIHYFCSPAQLSRLYTAWKSCEQAVTGGYLYPLNALAFIRTGKLKKWINERPCETRARVLGLIGNSTNRSKRPRCFFFNGMICFIHRYLGRARFSTQKCHFAYGCYSVPWTVTSALDICNCHPDSQQRSWRWLRNNKPGGRLATSS